MNIRLFYYVITQAHNVLLSGVLSVPTHVTWMMPCDTDTDTNTGTDTDTDTDAAILARPADITNLASIPRSLSLCVRVRLCVLLLGILYRYVRHCLVYVCMRVCARACV